MKSLSRKEKLFLILTNKNVDMKKEIFAGLTTFLTMAYIIAVNPSILSETGMPVGALVTATCLTAAISCILMGTLANLPIAVASGMGLNAYFTYTVVLQEQIPWQIALTAIFVAGIIFILLSLFKVRELVVNAIPQNMKLAVTAAIGIFIAFSGMSSAGIIVANESTKVALGEFTPAVIITVVGLVLIAVLEKRGVKGAILWGILASSFIAWGYAFINPELAASMGIYLPNGVFRFEGVSEIAGKIDLVTAFKPENLRSFFTIVFTFLFVGFFDTVGTLVGVCSKAKLIDKDGNVPNVGRALLVDAIGTTAGSLIGTSPLTAYIESSTGVAVGGRTGYTAITTGVLFIIAMFFSPIFMAIPACATAPALIYVGYLMLEVVKEIEFENITEGIPAFIAIVGVPLTYNIGDGLTLGILSYVIINVVYNMFFAKNAEEKRPISAVMYVLAVIFILKIVFL